MTSPAFVRDHRKDPRLAVLTERHGAIPCAFGTGRSKSQIISRLLGGNAFSVALSVLSQLIRRMGMCGSCKLRASL